MSHSFRYFAPVNVAPARITRSAPKHSQTSQLPLSLVTSKVQGKHSNAPSDLSLYLSLMLACQTLLPIPCADATSRKYLWSMGE